MMDIFSTANSLLQLNQLQVSKSLERLASGKRINNAGDDAAGLQLISVFESDIRGASQAQSNVQDASNLLSVAEGGLSSSLDNLQRIRELTVQASSDTLNQAQRDAISQEIGALSSNIDSVAQSTNFNGQQLLDGTANLTFQVGPGTGDTMNTTLSNAGTDGATGGLNLFNSAGGTTFTDAADMQANFTSANAQSFLSDIDNAINQVSSQMSQIGANQNQLESAANNLAIYTENVSAASSRISDVDVAAEMSNLIQSQIQQQASVSVMMQARESTRNFYNSFYKF